ncbi:MAG: GPW/gp25 family protein [Anaerolineales bacterium]|nr:MAG: GPW/gp25 family protein [Anaerolineales bacterium]
MQISYPFHLDGSGRLASASEEAHIEQLIEQLLFTNPGERVNRPDFGVGLMHMVFAPDSDELAAANQFLVQGALQQWLGDLIQVEAVEVQAQESSLQVTVRYLVLRNQQRRLSRFTHSPGY